MSGPVPWPASAVESCAIVDLRRHPKNSRTHPKAQVRALANGMLEWGWTQPMLVDEDGVILAGHGRLDAAELLVSEGETRFASAPVIRAIGWSDPQKRAYIIADNKIAQGAGWDSAILASELGDLSAVGFDLDKLGFGRVDLRKVMGHGQDQGNGDPDAAPDVPAIVVSRPGDLWKLGPHRLLCGDSTTAAHVSRLLGDVRPMAMLTDPPYCSGGFQEAGRASGSIGSRQVKKTKAHAGGIANDKLSTRGYLALMKGVLGLAPVAMCYIFTDWRMWTNVYDVAESSGFGVRNMVVWDKGHPGMGRGWRTQHELVLFGAKEPVAFLPAAAQGNVISSSRTGNKLHPTQKPVDLLAKVLAVTSMAETIYDPFTGSGSTLIACQQEGRVFFGLELSPGYVDVTVRRWQDFTQQEAVLEATGETYAARLAQLERGEADDAAWA